MSSISHTVAKPIISQPASEKVQRKQREKKDIVANIPGIILGLITFITAIVH